MKALCVIFLCLAFTASSEAGFLDFLKNIGQSLLGAVKGTVETIVKTELPSLSQILKDGFQELLFKMGSGGSNIVNRALGEDIQKILERIDLFRGGTMEHIKSALFHGIDTLGDIIGNALLHPLETSIHKVHEDLDNVLAKTHGELDGVLKHVEQNAAKFIFGSEVVKRNIFGDIFGNIGQTFKDLFNSAVTTAKQTFENIKTTAAQLLAGTIGAIKETTGDTIKTLKETLVGAFGGDTNTGTSN